MEQRASLEDTLIQINGPLWSDFHAQRAPVMPHMVLVELDDKTLQQHWRMQTASVPRERLAVLLVKLLSADPKYVLLDLDFSTKDFSTGADQRLQRVLTDRALVRGTEILIPRVRRLSQPFAPETGYYDAPAFSVANAPWVHWFDPEVRARNDNVQRWMNLWTFGRRAPDVSAEQVTLSAGLSVAILEDQAAGDGRQKLQKLEAMLNGGRNAPAGKISYTGNPLGLSPSLDRWVGSQMSEGREFRIVYPFTNHWSDPKYSPEDKCVAPSSVAAPLTYISAKSLNGVDGAALLSCLRGALVLVGRTDGRSGDWYQTPRDQMPGSAILASTIFTIMTLDHPVEESTIFIFVTIVSGLLILLAAEIYEYPAWAVLLGFPIASFLAYFVLFRWAVLGGRWFDLTPAVFITTATSYFLAVFGLLTPFSRAGREND